MNSLIETPQEELNRLNRESRAAQKKLNQRFADLYPIGTLAAYRHGINWRTVEIVKHCGERVRVRGESGSEYFIYHSNIWHFSLAQAQRHSHD